LRDSISVPAHQQTHAPPAANWHSEVKEQKSHSHPPAQCDAIISKAHTSGVHSNANIHSTHTQHLTLCVCAFAYQGRHKVTELCVRADGLFTECRVCYWRRWGMNGARESGMKACFPSLAKAPPCCKP